MLEEFQDQLNQQQQTLVELEDELEMEISRVIALKNRIDPELIEDLEKIEEGLYVEVKMINETKKNVDTILASLKPADIGDKDILMIEKTELEKYKADVEKFQKRSEKLAKQLIDANDEIEEMNESMEKKLKKRESELKNEVITQLKDKDLQINEKIIEAKKREDEILNELDRYRTLGDQGSNDVKRVKSFFDKKITNIKTNMVKESKQREKEIAEKAIIAYNKKKEKIYYTIIREALNMKSRPRAIEKMLNLLRTTLDLADDVYGLENFGLCNKCKDLIHISQSKCPNCNAKINW